MTGVQDLLQSARDDLSRGFSVRAGTRLRQAAQAGSAAALLELCSALLSGRVPGGAAEARRWLEAGGDRLEPDALFLRAGLRYAGTGGPVSSEDALEDLGEASVRGLPEAQLETAMLWQEYDEAKSQAAARYWAEQASPRDSLAGELLGLLDAEAPQSAAPVRAFAAVAVRPGKSLNAEPRIERFAAALNRIECAWLKGRARPSLAPSRVIDPETGAAQANPVRTSEAMCFDSAKPGIFVQRLAARLARLARLEVSHAEPLAVLRYVPGQEYRPHRDGLGQQALARDPLRAAGDRAATVLAWLAEPVGGGATSFPQLGLRVAPRTGDALVFSNLERDGRPSPRSLHAGEPVESGEKWLASLWIRERPIPR